MPNNGILNEQLICKALDKKCFFMLKGSWKEAMKKVFPNAKFYSKINCCLTQDYIKPDIIVRSDNNEFGISIKSSNATVMHEENIFSFIDFLRSIGVSEDTLTTILLYQFVDGTTDGSGKYRRDYYKTCDWLKERIKAANDELKSKKIIENVMMRCVFDGVNQQAMKAEFLYRGDEQFGKIISRTNVIWYANHSNWSFYENLHIGPLLLRPKARYAGKEILSEQRRNTIECNWHELPKDMDYIIKKLNR